MKKLLLFDFNNLFYRGTHVHRNLSYKGLPTGGIYGFVSQMASTIHEVQPDRIIVCTDSKPYLRSKIFPEYKQGRMKSKSSPEEQRAFRINSQACKDFLEVAGIPLISIRGLEADDLFAMIARKHSMKFRIIIASNDTDLYQLLDHAVVYRGKEKGFFDKQAFFREYPQMKKVQDWPRVSAIAGSHNGVPQVKKKVGVKTAIKLINLHSKRREWQELRKEHGKMIDRNLRLCILPYPGVTGEVLRVLPRNLWLKDHREVTRFLANFGIEYSGFMHHAFEEGC